MSVNRAALHSTTYADLSVREFEMYLKRLPEIGGLPKKGMLLNLKPFSLQPRIERITRIETGLLSFV